MKLEGADIFHSRHRYWSLDYRTVSLRCGVEATDIIHIPGPEGSTWKMPDGKYTVIRV
jgi:hypothetical protein